ncbi:hypothetical protein L6475_03220 [Prevotella sp. E9-3]|uniref:pullulanase X25 domain-containing protein n=1 Tax=Prevotella sp. E9-3 TaxID=2913621 RepID=UPI001EDB512E|nr:hypothetical protein [Prevotella sp. E9-3]UKK48991.1 hypothetical protein L6475_03220 [Prevotella sp. E9-3]
MKKIFTLIMMLAATLTMQAQDTWTVAGETAITGISWTPSDEANDMTTTDEITYTLVKEHMMVKAKDAGYGYKVVKNHSWDEAYPADNALLVINEDAEYKITFSFNSQSFEVSATAEKTGEYVAPEGDQTWTVAGVAELCGTAWDPTLTDNDMTTTDQVNYNWKKEDVALDKNTPYAFKVCADHAWDESYGNDEGGNYEISVNEPGLYTVEIAFNSNTKAISVTTTKTADHSFAEKTWTICGKAELCGSEWDPADTTNDMIKTNEGEFTLVRRNVALIKDTEYEFKVAANHSWSESYGNDMGENQVFKLDEGLEDGNYDVTFYFLVEAKTLWAEAEVADPAGVTTMKADKASKFVIYNLQGQRVANNYRGIAIHNGKKVVIK